MQPFETNTMRWRVVERLRGFVTNHPRLTVAYVMVVSTLASYLPFLGDLDTLGRFWDGPMYLVVAKTFYHLSNDEALSIHWLPASYYACHLPAYPFMIRLCTLLMLGDWTLGMLLATLVCSTLAAVLFYEVLVAFKAVSSPLWTAILFCFLPPRWLIYHAVGASEPLFLCLVFACFLAYQRHKPWWLITWICLASLTRITGVLLGPAFLLVYLLDRRWKQALLVPLSGVGLLLLFLVYQAQFGDFMAYFSYNLDQEKIVRWPPLGLLSSFIKSGACHEVEYHLMMYGVYGVGTVLLWHQRPFFVFAAIYFLFMTFVHHNDVARYFLGSASLALLVGYDQVLSKRMARFIVFLLVPLFYLYAWHFIPKNSISPGRYEKIMNFRR